VIKKPRGQEGLSPHWAADPQIIIIIIIIIIIGTQQHPENGNKLPKHVGAQG
jgi:uncharacterized membrane protein